MLFLFVLISIELVCLFLIIYMAYENIKSIDRIEKILDRSLK